MKNVVDIVAILVAVCLMLFGGFVVWVVLSNVVLWGCSLNLPAFIVGILIFAFGAYMF